jgi:hypothetical protein
MYRFKIAADEVEKKKSEAPAGLLGGAAGAATGIGLTMPRLYRSLQTTLPLREELPAILEGLSASAAERAKQEFYAPHLERRNALLAAVTVPLATATIGAGMDMAARRLGQAYRAMKEKHLHAVNLPAEEPKLAFNRSTVMQRKLGPHTFHIEYPEGMDVGGVRSKYDYGYLPGRKGPDGDSLDFYLGHNPEGSIARFTKKLPGVEGVADHKYFAGFSPEELEDYQKNFQEYTRQPGVSLTDRVDFKNWDELNKHLESLPKTGPLTHLQELWAKKAPVKYASIFESVSRSATGHVPDVARKATASALDEAEKRLPGIVEGAVAPIMERAPQMVHDVVNPLMDRAPKMVHDVVNPLMERAPQMVHDVVNPILDRLPETTEKVIDAAAGRMKQHNEELAQEIAGLLKNRRFQGTAGALAALYGAKKYYDYRQNKRFRELAGQHMAHQNPEFENASELGRMMAERGIGAYGKTGAEKTAGVRDILQKALAAKHFPRPLELQLTH